MDKLTMDFKKSLFENGKDSIKEYLELGIDSFIEDGALKEIPIVSSIVSVLKIGKNVHDRNLLNQTLQFLNEFNDGSINVDKLMKYKATIEHNPKKCQEELERVVLLLNNNIDGEKSVILAKLFKAYINEEINWIEFCEFSEILNRLFIQDLKLLNLIYQGTVSDTTDRDDLYRVERLNSLGIIGLSFKSSKISSINGIMQENRQDSYLAMNIHGKKFMSIISK